MESYNLNPEEKWKITEETIVGNILKDNDKGFSEPDVINQKIKKIRRNRKIKNNYKNIELFENIQDSTGTSNQTITEGLSDGIARFKETDYVGGKDDIYEGGEKKNIDADAGLAGFIEKTFNKTRALTYRIAYSITKRFSSSKDYNHNDVYVVQRYVGWSFSIILSCFIVYNWVFIMFYKDAAGNKVELPDVLSRENFDTQSTFNVGYRLLDYFIHYSLFFPEKLQVGIKFIADKVPDYLNASICFSVLFFIVVFGCYHSLSTLEKFLLAIAKFDYTNPLLWFMYSVLCILLALSFFEYDLNPLNYAYKFNPFTGPIYLITTILRYVFILFLGVPIAGLLCFFYLLIYSFFGIFLLNGFDIKKARDIFTNIDKFCKESKPEIRRETPCEPYTIFERLINTINIWSDIIYKNVFSISLAYMLIYGIVEYWPMGRLRSKSLMTVLIPINMIILMSIIMKISNYKVDYKDPEEPIVPPKT
jgi:hypothetical protein